MWTPLTELTEAEFQRLATLGPDDRSPEYGTLVRLIAGRPYAGHLAAVTSHGNLSFSSTLRHEEHPPHGYLPAIGVVLQGDRTIGICYDPGSAGSGEPPHIVLAKTPIEAASLIDTVMNRLLHDLPVARRSAEEAAKRKHQWRAAHPDPSQP